MNMRLMTFLRLVLSVILAGCALTPMAHHACAQSTDITVTVDEVDISDFPAVQLRVSIRDENGVPIHDLGAEHFEIIEDGAATFEPTSVDTQVNPQAQVAIAIVIDMYRTLSGEPIEAAQQATSDLLAELLNEPNDPDHAAFVGVRQGLSTDPAEIDETYEVPFTNDRNKLLNVISFLHENMEQGAGTPLYDALVKAVRLAAATEPVGHRAVIVMTDGEDFGSVSTDSDTIQSATRVRTPIFTIGLSNSRLNEQYLRRLADQTGGTYQAAQTPDDFSLLFSNVLTMLRTQYVLSYDSALPQDGQTHSLVVHVRTPVGLEGFQEHRIETPGTLQEGVAQEATPTPSPPAPTPTPEPSEDTVEGFVSTLRDWVDENTLPAILIVAAIGLLSVGLLTTVIITIRRRGQEEEEEVLLPPEAPPFPATPTPALAGNDNVGRATADGAPGQTGTELMGGTTSPPASAGVGARSPFAGPEVQPSAASGTRLIERKPKMSIVGSLIDRQHLERRFDIVKPTITIGRTQSCDVVIDHTTVSREHAAIKLEQGQFRVYDLGSTNGTFVGEQRVREPIVLEDGVTVRFGEMEFIFKIVSLDA